MAVPIVDISAWTYVSDDATGETFGQPVNLEDLNDSQREVAAEWKNAMKTLGCVVLVGHGISPGAFERMDQSAMEFFSKPLIEKMRYNHGKYGHPSGGYTPPGNETVALSMDEQRSDQELPQSMKAKQRPKFDPVENFVFTTPPENFVFPQKSDEREAPAEPFDFAKEYYSKMERLLSVLHSITSAALGLSDLQYFEKFYNAKLPGNEGLGINGNALRLAHYPPMDAELLRQASSATLIDVQETHSPPLSGFDSSSSLSLETSSPFDAQIRYGAHTDYQGYTILRPDVGDWGNISVLPLQGDNGTATAPLSSAHRHIAEAARPTHSINPPAGAAITATTTDNHDTNNNNTNNNNKIADARSSQQEPSGVVGSAQLSVVGGGLEVQERISGRWLPVVVPADLNALVVNAGDLIQRWTNDQWHSPVHRVVVSASHVLTVPLDSALYRAAAAGCSPTTPSSTTSIQVRVTSATGGTSVQTPATAGEKVQKEDVCLFPKTTTDDSSEGSGGNDTANCGGRKCAQGIEEGADASANKEASRSRRSLVFFTGPLEESVITVLPECCGHCPTTTSHNNTATITSNNSSSGIISCSIGKNTSGDNDVIPSARYAPIKSGDHLRMKLDRTN